MILGIMNMQELYRSGLPLFLDETGSIKLGEGLTFDGSSRKFVNQMEGLFEIAEPENPEEAVYDVYRGIRYPADEALFDQYQYRYDITVIFDGKVGSERKKTSGHYHGFTPDRTATYAEVYEVIKGKALYVLQKSLNFENLNEEIQLEDVKLAVVNEGETIIIPPNYGHCSVNIGAGPLIFSNLAYVPCAVHYDQVKRYRGMSFYIHDGGNDEFTIVPNPNYQANLSFELVKVQEAPGYGIKFGVPVYQSFIAAPERFSYLAEPAAFSDPILNLLTEIRN